MPIRRARLGWWVAAATALVPLATASCDDDAVTSPPQAGSIQVSAVTSDPGDSNGYTVSVDYGAGPALAANGSVTFANRSPGDHTVLLGDIDGHCQVSGENPRTVTVTTGETAAITFEVECLYTGDLKVTTTTSGISPAAYEFTVDGGTWPIAENETLTVEELSAGPHDVLLVVPSACTVGGFTGSPNPKTANVPPDGTVEVRFDVHCPPPIGSGLISNQIVFVRDYSNIYVMGEDGSNARPLTAQSGEYSSPAVSPDGSHIAYVINYAGFGSDIFVMNADGTGRVNVTGGGFDGPQNEHPAWSPDGSRILFASDRDNYTSVENSFNIFVMNADGSDVTRLTDQVGNEWSPSWSPDGSQILFGTGYWGYTGDSDLGEIYVMNADGSGPRTNLTDHPGHDYSASWSPDGSRIVFTTDRDGVSRVYVMNADGSGQTNLSSGLGRDGSPSWSPDGSRILFVSSRDEDEEVYVMNADGSGQTNLTNSPDSNDVPGSPQGWR
jgi:WD40-like Beta Propeller Repeat